MAAHCLMAGMTCRCCSAGALLTLWNVNSAIGLSADRARYGNKIKWHLAPLEHGHPFSNPPNPFRRSAVSARTANSPCAAFAFGSWIQRSTQKIRCLCMGMLTTRLVYVHVDMLCTAINSGNTKTKIPTMSVTRLPFTQPWRVSYEALKE